MSPGSVARSGKVGEMRAILERHPELATFVNSAGHTFFVSACLGLNFDMAVYLGGMEGVETDGAFEDFSGQRHDSVLAYLLSNPTSGRFAVQLLERLGGLRVPRADPALRGALEVALECLPLDLFVRFLDASSTVDLEELSIDGHSLLCQAILSGQVGLVEEILTRLDLSNAVGLLQYGGRDWPPINLAAAHSSFAVVVVLAMEQPSRVERNERDPVNGETLLTYLLKHHHVGSFFKLLEQPGFDLTATNALGQTVFDLLPGVFAQKTSEGQHLYQEALRLVQQYDPVHGSSQVFQAFCRPLEDKSESKFRDACRSGDVQRVARHISWGFANALDHTTGLNALHQLCCSRKPSMPVVQYILSSGLILPNVPSKTKIRALDFSLELDSPEVLLALLQCEDLDPNYLNHAGATPLTHCIRRLSYNGPKKRIHMDLLKKLLLCKRLDLEFPDSGGWNPMQLATRHELAGELLPLLLRGKRYLSSQVAPDNLTAHGWALSKNKYGISQILHGEMTDLVALVAAVSTERTERLWRACRDGDLETAKREVWHGGDVDWVNPASGTSAAMEACRRGHLGVVQLLLAEAEVDWFANSPILKLNAFQLAYREGRVEVVRMLHLSLGIDVMDKDLYQQTALSFAVASSDVAMVKAVLPLIDQPERWIPQLRQSLALISPPDPLQAKQMEIYRLLERFLQDVTEARKLELWEAASRGDFDAVVRLSANVAANDPPEGRPHTALTEAILRDRELVVSYLSSLPGVRGEAKPGALHGPVSAAVDRLIRSGSTSSLKMLMDNAPIIDLNSPDFLQGETLLTFACKRRMWTLLELLHGRLDVESDALNQQGESPLDILNLALKQSPRDRNLREWIERFDPGSLGDDTEDQAQKAGFLDRWPDYLRRLKRSRVVDDDEVDEELEEELQPMTQPPSLQTVPADAIATQPQLLQTVPAPNPTEAIATQLLDTNPSIGSSWLPTTPRKQIKRN